MRFDQIVGALYLAPKVIYGIPTLVSATYIFLFILFGSFLEHAAGMISLFNNIALGSSDTPAAAGESGCHFFGNDGNDFRFGRGQRADRGPVHHPSDEALRYSPVFAGAVEATASMGGQIMPPVTGGSCVHHG